MRRKKETLIRDPVHGDIRLSAEELALLDTAEMQRCRGVRQLGTAYLVYPGANHSRFEHMIGSCHMASEMIRAIERNRSHDPERCLGVTPEEERLIRFAALVHDVSHIPFGHNIEDQTGLFERHDTPRRLEQALGAGALGARLGELGALDTVLGILDAGTAAAAIPPYWKQVVGDTLCADIFDYLKRDAYYTGLALSYDRRLIESFKVDRDSGNLYIDVEKRGLLREDVLSEIVRMLEARYFFSERVYYHHAKIAAGALVAKAVEYALAGSAARQEDFRDQTDDTLVAFLEGLDYGSDAATRRARGLMTRFRSRRLFKRCGVYPLYANRESQQGLLDRYFAPGRHPQRIATEQRIEERARAALGREVEVMLYCPARRMQLKEARTHVRLPGETRVRPLSDFRERIPRLADLERCYADLWKFYVFTSESGRAAVAAIQAILAEELAGAVNVYRPGGDG